jgi:hypothetical protein
MSYRCCTAWHCADPFCRSHSPAECSAPSSHAELGCSASCGQPMAEAAAGDAEPSEGCGGEVRAPHHADCKSRRRCADASRADSALRGGDLDHRGHRRRGLGEGADDWHHQCRAPLANSISSSKLGIGSSIKFGGSSKFGCASTTQLGSSFKFGGSSSKFGCASTTKLGSSKLGSSIKFVGSPSKFGCTSTTAVSRFDCCRSLHGSEEGIGEGGCR